MLRYILAATTLLGLAVAVTPAQAGHTSFGFSYSEGYAPRPAYYAPYPQYYVAQPAYYPPPPVYAAPPVYYAPQPVYYAPPQPVYYAPQPAVRTSIRVGF